MAIRDFWISTRAGASLLSPKATVDSPKLDASRIERLLRNADIWLTPKSVEGFDESDFSFLSKAEQSKLTTSVKKFRDVAEHVPPAAPATEDQVKKARPQFQNILTILRMDKFGDPDALVIGKQLEQRLTGQLPNWVHDLRIDTGTDANGDPAVWVWVVVDDSATRQDVISDNFKTVQEQIAGCLRVIVPNRWPYIRLRSDSEQANNNKVEK